MTDQQGYKSITGLVDRAPSPLSQLSTEQGGGVRLCSRCNSVIVGTAYQVNSRPACATCASTAAIAGPSTAGVSPYLRSILFGVGAAVIGMAFYATFTIVTHIYIGYVALAVGWFVGKAMMTGSNGEGGPRYQIAAAVLTYAAISIASIPIYFIPNIGNLSTDGVDWISLVGKLLLLGVASPFLELTGGFSGIIGLVILFVGIRVAWRITAAKPQMVAPAITPTARPDLGL